MTYGLAVYNENGTPLIGEGVYHYVVNGERPAEHVTTVSGVNYYSYYMELPMTLSPNAMVSVDIHSGQASSGATKALVTLYTVPSGNSVIYLFPGDSRIRYTQTPKVYVVDTPPPENQSGWGLAAYSATGQVTQNLTLPTMQVSSISTFTISAPTGNFSAGASGTLPFLSTSTLISEYRRSGGNSDLLTMIMYVVKSGDSTLVEYMTEYFTGFVPGVYIPLTGQVVLAKKP